MVPTAKAWMLFALAAAILMVASFFMDSAGPTLRWASGALGAVMAYFVIMDLFVGPLQNQIRALGDQIDSLRQETRYLSDQSDALRRQIEQQESRRYRVTD